MTMPNSKSPAPMSVEEADPYAAFIAGAQFCIELSEGVITPADVMPEVLAEAECRFPVPDSHLLDTGDEEAWIRQVCKDGCDHVEKIERETAARKLCPEHGLLCSGRVCCCADLHVPPVPGTLRRNCSQCGEIKPLKIHEQDVSFCCVKCAEEYGTVPASPPVPSTGDEAIRHVANILQDSKPLDPEDERILRENLSDLYDSVPVPDTEKVKTEPTATLDALVGDLATAHRMNWPDEAEYRTAIHQHVAALVQAEREACAKIALKHLCPAHPLGIGIPDAIAKEIRDRSDSTGISNE